LPDALNLVFDLDGTLIDSLPSIHHSANKVFTDKGLNGFPEAVVRGFVGDGAGALVSRLLQHCDLPPEGDLQKELLHNLIDAYDDAHHLTTLYPGALAALQRIKSDGHRLAICTNKPERPARTVLEHFGLDSVFKSVIGGDTLAYRKPDPRMLQAAIQELGHGPTIFVGDSEVDAATASAAGVPFVLFSGGYRKAEVESLGAKIIFDHHAALPGLVAHLAARLRTWNRPISA
jgi:phosphoglycolate phosphatase